jgi:hypothetical protein
MQLLAVYYMVLSTKPLGHPRAKYGKGVLVGATFFIALHICNIAAQVCPLSECSCPVHMSHTHVQRFLHVIS